MGQINPTNFAFHIKEGDLASPIKTKIYQGSTSIPYDLTGWTVTFSMALVDTPETLKVANQSCTVADAANGEVEYRWASGDTDTAGSYTFEFMFTKDARFFTEPTISPGLVIVETRLG